MSMSTPGPDRVPSTVKVGKTSGQGKPPAGKPGANKAGNRPGSRPAGKGRKPITPVKVAGGRNWGPLAVAGLVVVIAAGIIGYGVWAAVQNSKGWEDKMTAISGVVNYRAQKDPVLESRQHKDGTLSYKTSPPVGGDHNGLWQNCEGNIYDAPIANEHAVHSLEHGAVWIAYKPGLDADQIDSLKKKVQGKTYMLMSPYTGLDKNVSVQVWGYQLKTDDVNDKRIDDFIKAGRQVASVEPGAICSSGNTTTGPVTAAPATGAGAPPAPAATN
jgi:hypothetical protein